MAMASPGDHRTPAGTCQFMRMVRFSVASASHDSNEALNSRISELGRPAFSLMVDTLLDEEISSGVLEADVTGSPKMRGNSTANVWHHAESEVFCAISLAAASISARATMRVPPSSS